VAKEVSSALQGPRAGFVEMLCSVYVVVGGEIGTKTREYWWSQRMKERMMHGKTMGLTWGTRLDEAKFCGPHRTTTARQHRDSHRPFLCLCLSLWSG